MTTSETWRAYVLGLCTMWGLNEEASMGAMRDIAGLVATSDVTEETISAVLVSAGLARVTADLAAPTIRAAIPD
jgi:hypothetical protein